MNKYQKIIPIGGLVALCALFTPSSVFAAGALFQDTFDSGQLSSWQSARNQQWLNPTQPCEWFAQAADWQIIDGKAGISLFSNPCITELAAKNLNLSVTSPYQVSFDWTFSEQLEMDRGFVFAWQNPQNFYTLKQFGNTFTIIKVIDGQEKPLQNPSAPAQLQAGATYHMLISVELGKKISVSLNGATILDVSDALPLFTSTSQPITVALQAGTGANAKTVEFFDNVVVENVPTTPVASDVSLLVAPWKQSDPAWKDLEYDHGTAWSENPTIRRWGCALTSAAMILDFHGIQQLPDGTPLNPATLNEWLKGQADGYFSTGSINWIAVTRLTKLVSDKLQTPKLEYKRESSLVDVALQHLQKKLPVVLEIPGHFLVGKGYTADKTDLLIQDPAYAFTHFSQHKVALSSVRTFTPSQTDLSYLLITAPKDVQVEVRDQAGQPLPTSISSSDIITDPIDGKSTPQLQEVEFAKPATGTYQIVVKKPQAGTYDVQVYAYDQAAQPTVSQLHGITDASGDTYQITYKKDGKSKIQKKANWKSLRTQIRELEKKHAFHRPRFAKELLLSAEIGERAPKSGQRILLQVVQLTLRLTKRTMTDEAFELLNEECTSLAESLKK